MQTIADILAQNPTPPDRKRRKADKEEIVEPITKTRKQISFTYEDSVFNYLFENKQDLGIEQVYRLKNQRMDGELVLTDGSLVVIEIKMCMNWLKACQSGSQLRTYLSARRKAFPELPDPKAAIVFFEEFTGDWNRKMKSHATVLGWIGWYNGHNQIDGIPFQLVRLRNSSVEAYDDALKSAAPSGLV